jgi:hypothetical protein
MLSVLLVVAAIAAPAASARPIDRVLPPGTVHGFQERTATLASGTATPASGTATLANARKQAAITRDVSSQTDGSSEPSVQVIQPSSDGFNWGDAGIGGAVVFTMLSLGTAALLIGRRSRERRSAATS